MLIDIGLYIIYNFSKENKIEIPKIKIHDTSCKDCDCPNSIGLYHYKLKTVEVFLQDCTDLRKDDFINASGTSCLSTLIHEYGHFLYHLYCIKKEIELEKYAVTYSNYTKSFKGDIIEKIANDFVIFVLNPDWLKKYRPLVYKFFTNEMKLIPINPLNYLEIRKIIKQL